VSQYVTNNNSNNNNNNNNNKRAGMSSPPEKQIISDKKLSLRELITLSKTLRNDPEKNPLASIPPHPQSIKSVRLQRPPASGPGEQSGGADANKSRNTRKVKLPEMTSICLSIFFSNINLTVQIYINLFFWYW
jgi:hypothetical protein